MTLDDFRDSVIVVTGPNPLHPTSYEVGFRVGSPPTLKLFQEESLCLQKL